MSGQGGDSLCVERHEALSGAALKGGSVEGTFEGPRGRL